MHFLYSAYYELTASTCFEHCLPIFGRCCLNNLYIVCVLYQLAAARVGVPWQQTADIMRTQYTNCCLGSAS
jgi:hypothetical protein